MNLQYEWLSFGIKFFARISSREVLISFERIFMQNIKTGLWKNPLLPEPYSLSRQPRPRCKIANPPSCENGNPLNNFNEYNSISERILNICTESPEADILETILLIAPVIVEQAATYRDADDLKRLRHCLKSIESATDAQQLLSSYTEFHCHLAASAKNGVLLLATHSLFTAFAKLPNERIINNAPARLMLLQDIHCIYSYIKSKNCAMAKEMMINHLSSIGNFTALSA